MIAERGGLTLGSVFYDVVEVYFCDVVSQSRWCALNTPSQRVVQNKQ